MVRILYSFRPAEYAELKRAIELRASLKHRSLISTVRILESKNSGHFEVFLEYVEQSMEMVMPQLTNEELSQAKSDLIDLCQFLIQMGIAPEVTGKHIGFTKKTLKLYVDVCKLDQKINKKEAIGAKLTQIEGLFSRFSKKATAPTATTIRNFTATRSQEVIANNSSLVAGDKTSEENRNTSLTNFLKKPSNNRATDITKIHNIDEKIRRIQQNMSKPAVKQSRPSHFSSNDSPTRRESADVKINQALHNYMEAHQYGNLREGRDAPVIYPTIGLAVEKYE